MKPTPAPIHLREPRPIRYCAGVPSVRSDTWPSRTVLPKSRSIRRRYKPSGRRRRDANCASVRPRAVAFRRPACDRRMLISRRCRGGVLLFGQRFFSRIQVGLALRELFFFLRLMLGIETLLHLAVDLGLPFGVGLLFLTRTKDRQCDHEWQNKNPFHGTIRPLLPCVIRRKAFRERDRVLRAR